MFIRFIGSKLHDPQTINKIYSTLWALQDKARLAVQNKLVLSECEVNIIPSCKSGKGV